MPGWGQAYSRGQRVLQTLFSSYACFQMDKKHMTTNLAHILRRVTVFCNELLP